MLVIRLSRKGRRNHPMYRITVAENSMPTDGKFVEVVGNYNPTALDQPLSVQKDRVEYWISKGAKPTNTVAKLLNKQGFTLPVLEYHKAPKKVAKPVEAAPAAPVAPAAAEKPAEEEVVPAEEQPAVDKSYDPGQSQDDDVMKMSSDSGVAPEASQNDEEIAGNSDATSGVVDAKTE